LLFGVGALELAIFLCNLLFSLGGEDF
jgi:hypothetical protein